MDRNRSGLTDILLVEDNPADALLTREALAEANYNGQVWVASDGEEALHFLNRSDRFVSVPRPDLIILDLNLPRCDGREVLATVKADDRLKQIPVVVLTTSSAEQDIARCYKLRANAFITKPDDFDRFCAVIGALGCFWGETARLPRGE